MEVFNNVWFYLFWLMFAAWFVQWRAWRTQKEAYDTSERAVGLLVALDVERVERIETLEKRLEKVAAEHASTLRALTQTVNERDEADKLAGKFQDRLSRFLESVRSDTPRPSIKRSKSSRTRSSITTSGRKPPPSTSGVSSPFR